MNGAKYTALLLDAMDLPVEIRAATDAALKTDRSGNPCVSQ